jgi:hypothetical protein
MYLWMLFGQIQDSTFSSTMMIYDILISQLLCYAAARLVDSYIRISSSGFSGQWTILDSADGMAFL